jgi:hypothetical protein
MNKDAIEIIEPCPGCGRRSSQMWGTYCRNCSSYMPDPAEKESFLALCERQKVKMTSHEIYFRRRKNALKLAALAWSKRADAKGLSDGVQSKLILRKDKLFEHFVLIDEIWNYLNPERCFASDWGKVFEVAGAVNAIKEGTFDKYVDKAHQMN